MRLPELINLEFTISHCSLISVERFHSLPLSPVPQQKVDEGPPLPPRPKSMELPPPPRPPKVHINL